MKEKKRKQKKKNYKKSRKTINNSERGKENNSHTDSRYDFLFLKISPQNIIDFPRMQMSIVSWVLA